MSNTNTGGPAFPQVSTDQNGDLYQPGLSMRDYFAAKAMQSLILDSFYQSEGKIKGWDEFADSLADEAYEIANAMIQAREA